MKILVIHTGGTIGSDVNGNTVSPSGRSEIIERFKKIDGDYDFKEIFLCGILSENADDSFYEKLINYIYELNTDVYDGIIITHGTDTLPYTASLVSMALRHLSVPVAFVSSSLVPSDEDSNALDNLGTALGYISSGGKGFVVPNLNSNSRRLIHLATRLLEADEVSDDFSSFGGAPFAEVVKNYLVTYEDKTGVSANEIAIPKKKIFEKKLSLKNKILLIKAFPSIDYSCFDISRVKAVLHTAYHSGTACADALPDFIKRCSEKGVDFYLCPVKDKVVQYETTEKLLSCGAKPIYGTSVPSALAKLKLKYNLPIYFDINESLYYERFKKEGK